MEMENDALTAFFNAYIVKMIRFRAIVFLNVFF